MPALTCRGKSVRYWHNVASLRQVGTYLVSCGIPPGPVLESYALPASILLNVDAWVERDTCMRLGSDLSRMLDDPYLGLHVAELARFEDYGPWGEGILRAPTIGQALRFAARSIGLIHTGTRISIFTDADFAVVSGSYVRSNGRPVQHDLALLMVLHKLLGLAREPVPVEVRLSLPHLRFSDELDRLLGPRLRCCCSENQIRFPSEALDLPLQPLATREGGINGPFSAGRPIMTGKSVFRRVQEIVDLERPTIRRVAEDLGINVRTLQRQLEALGVTFEQIVDEYRQVVAFAELTAGNLNVTDIAFRLGYSDSAHFTRAVRRWTGHTPQQVRFGRVTPHNWRFAPPSGLEHALGSRQVASARAAYR